MRSFAFCYFRPKGMNDKVEVFLFTSTPPKLSTIRPLVRNLQDYNCHLQLWFLTINGVIRQFSTFLSPSVDPIHPHHKHTFYFVLPLPDKYCGGISRTLINLASILSKILVIKSMSTTPCVYGGGGGIRTPVLSVFRFASTNCILIYTTLKG